MRFFFVLLFIGILSFFPAQRAYAITFCDMTGMFCSSQEEKNTETKTVSEETNSQTMMLVDAPRNSNLNQKSEEDEYVATIEGSALAANHSVSQASSGEKSKTNLYTDQISVYVVHNGDTLSDVAKMFDVSANTIRWANDIPKGGSLKVGQKLVILPVSGIQYTIKKGDTINKIAKKYSADAQEIRDFNGADDSSLQIGDVIIIPNGETPVQVITTVKKVITNIFSPEPSIQTDGYFIRPALGAKTQGIHGRNGVDFSAKGGSSVFSAAAGRVLISMDSGYNGGYGHYVVIEHSNGTQTLYAHLSANFVSSGDSVVQGQTIGNMGNTGKSTGTHLHFEIRGARNPF